MTMFFKHKQKQKLVVMGIDGVPYSFLKKQIERGDLPHLEKIFQNGSFRQINSVYPTVSSVAWSSYMTGKNPGEHGIFGFVDRVPNPFAIFIPTAKYMKAETIWELFSQKGKRIIVINVPLTYPPKPVNGILIGGFLGTDINKIGYPRSINDKLKAMDYRIDVDAWEGRKEDKTQFLKDLHYTLDKRFEAAIRLLESEDWDFFQLHVMETDRINHFLWEQWESGDARYEAEFLKFYQKLDRHIGQMVKAITDDSRTDYIIMSDHGFCTVKKEVYLNYWLQKEGYLMFETKAPKNVNQMSAKTQAYSLIPGRIFINLKGREEKGSVEPAEYESLRDELLDRLLTMVDPDSGEKIIQKVVKREDIYSGFCFEQAADLIAVPYDGSDLKGNVDTAKLTHKGELVGMHTFNDAFVFVSDEEFFRSKVWESVGDVGSNVLEYFD